MPCHPDRVRRNQESAEETAARDREFEQLRQRIAEAEAQLFPEDGLTANVIEGDEPDLWGV
jgi:hypothetical protein